MSEKMNLRVEVSFDTAAFMQSVRRACGLLRDDEAPSLRDMETVTGISASTLSRIDNGNPPDMKTFCAICGTLNLMPERYFSRTLWQRVDGGEGK